jgi:hypothetical protein
MVAGFCLSALFGQNHQGTVVRRLLMASFLFAAVAPLSYAFLIERFGGLAAVHLSLGLAAVTLAAAVLLKVRFGQSCVGAEGRV